MKFEWKKKIVALSMVAIMSLVGLAACGQTESNSEDSNSGGSSTSALLDESSMFTERDLASSYNNDGATKISFDGNSIKVDGDGAEANGTTLTITKEGTYICEGELNDGQIVVDADKDKDKVQIVLNGVEITNDDSSAILVLAADKTFVTIPKGKAAKLSDTGDEYKQNSDDYTVDGVIFARDDLVINGEGTLDINAGYKHGVVGKDDLKLVDVGLDVTAPNGKGVAANDSIRIASGSYKIDSGDDSLHTSNDENEEKGYIYIKDGDFDLSSGDDGIHAESTLLIKDGNIDVKKSYEGLEGHVICIDGGDIDIKASDDGINAAGGSEDSKEDVQGGNPQGGPPQDDMQGGPMEETDEDAKLTINGGKIVMDAEGDGLDSNGYMEITGGDILVYGPTNGGNGALDVGIDATITGGTVIAAGSSGMAETFGENSKQYSILYNFEFNISEGSKISLENAEGKTVLSFTAKKDMSSVVFSSKDIEKGSYTIDVDGEKVSVEVNSVVTTAGSQQQMMPM